MSASRPPIVVILGHVDHGKTSLLDYLRKSNVAAREAGGITQHIRSFQAEFDIDKTQKSITFIDTPGHAAFANMRSRGSRIADMAILVVSAVDGVMPQTKQSIEFIKSAKIPFIVAINKSDLPDSNPDKIKTQLSELDVIVEDYGGEVPAVSVSAKTGLGVTSLLEIISLLSDLHPATADADGQLQAIVLESRLDPKKGPVATVIVRNGTLSVGQSLFQQSQVGKVKSLIDSNGAQIKSAPPSTPVEILGLSSVPEVGSDISSTPISPQASVVTHSTPGNTADFKLNLIVKSDVAGSLEAILASLGPEINIISSGTGDITESDVLLAQSSKAKIVGFSVRVPGSVAKLAEIDKVTIHSFDIIYRLLESMDEIIHPKNTEVITGRAEVLAEFKYDSDRVAGCKCIEGELKKGDKLRIMRGTDVVGETKFKSIRTGKTTTLMVKSGTEFGAVLSPYLDFKVGDYIIAHS